MLVNYNDYKDGGSHKSFTISVVGENITVTNENMRQDSITLDEALCSERNLRFGCCESSQFSVHIANVFENFEGKQIQVSVTMDNKTTKYGTFKVKSDKPTADRIHRKLVAYDAMNDIINTNVLTWFKGLTFPITLKNFRDSFFSYLGITQETSSLINDDFVILGGFTASDSLSGRLIITSICELNGVFGHINRDGKFDYIDLTASSSFDCPPYENNSVKYEDYVTSAITKVTMRGTASDVGTSVGTDGNEYIIQGNPLIYGSEGKPALVTAMTRLLNKIKNVVFRPFELGKTIGNPCVELGDAISIETKYETIESYVLRRTLTGIQALRDKYSAEGDDVYPAGVSILQDEISRTKGRMLEIESSVDGLRIIAEEISEDLDENYYNKTEIDQTVEEITLAASQTYTEKSNAIKTDTLYYLATSAGSGVTRDTPGWTTTIQNMTATNKYLWTYHLYTYDDNHTSPTNPVITGRWGDTGDRGTGFVWNMLWDTNVNGLTKVKGPNSRYVESNTTGTYSYEFVEVTDPPVTGINYGYHVTTDNSSGHRLVFYTGDYLQVKSGEKYTLSCYCKWISGNDASKIRCTIRRSVDGTSVTTYSKETFVKDSNWHKYSFTFTADASMAAGKVRLYFAGLANSSNTGVAYEAITCGWKMEEGEVATEWSLHPDETIGEEGATGPTGTGILDVTPIYYSSSSSTAPDAPTSVVTSTSTSAGQWTKAIPALDSTNKYLYTCDQIHYDDSSVGTNGYTWTTVTLNNAITDLNTRMSAAELKITDSAIVSTVTSSGQVTTTEQFNALSIGGRNLRVGTSSDWVKTTLTNIQNQGVAIIPSATPFDITAIDCKAGDKIQVGFDIQFSSNITYASNKNQYLQANKNVGGTRTAVSYAGGNLSTKLLEVANSNTKTARLSSYFLVTEDMLNGTYTGKFYIGIRFDYWTGDVYIRNVKLEKGDKATDWTPAPEDAPNYTDSRVDNLQVGGTNLLTEAKIPNKKATTTGIIKEYLGDGVWYCHGTSTATSNQAPQIYGANIVGSGKYTASLTLIEGDFPAATSGTTYPIYIQIACTADGTTTPVTSQWQLNKDTKTVTFEVPTGETLYRFALYIRSTSSGTVMNCKFRLKLESGDKATGWSPSPDDTYSQITGIQVGGRNYLHNTKTMSNWTPGSRTTFGLETDGSSYARMAGSTADWGAGFIAGRTLSTELLDGTPWILSFEYQASSDISSFYINAMGTASGEGSTDSARTKYGAFMDPQAETSLPSTNGLWKTFKVQGRNLTVDMFTSGSGTVGSWTIQMYNRTNGVSVNVRKLMLERGTRATNWAENPDDTIVGGTQMLWDTNVNSLTKVDAAYDRYIESVNSAGYSYTFDELTNATAPVNGIKYAYHLTQTNTAAKHSLVFYNNNNGIKLIQGKEYTVSVYCKWISGADAKKIALQVYDGTSHTVCRLPIEQDGKWHQYSFTFTANANMQSNGFRFYGGGLTTSSNGNVVYEAMFCGWKLEEGNVVTAWSEHPDHFSSKSEVTQLSNKIALKVNSSGRLVAVALGVDPASSTSYVKVKADDIDIISNGNIQLAAGTLGIDSTNFKVNKTAGNVEVTGAIITTSLKIDNKAYLSIVNTNSPSETWTWNDPPINPPQRAESTIMVDMLTLTSTYGLKIDGEVRMTSGLRAGGPIYLGGPSATVDVSGHLYIEGPTRVENYFVVSGESYFQNYVDIDGILATSSHVSVGGNLIVSGVKNRNVHTEDYGDRLLYCYETAAPMFGDIGEGKIAEDGKCYIWLDGAFSETIKTESYQVFLQKYGQGECYVTERTSRYFVVEGDAGMRFGWELKAKQAGYENLRLETYRKDKPESNTANYGEDAIYHITNVKNEREVV